MPSTPLFFGNIQRFQNVPMPSSGIQRRNVFFSEAGTMDRGGGFVTQSSGRHVEFDFSFGVREAAGTEGLNVYLEYATGMWDDWASVVSGYNPNNLIYFADPMSMRGNLFSPHWASPMLCLTGDYPGLGAIASHAATAANIYRQPPRTVTFNVTHTANTLPTEISRRFYIPIPPGYTLRWGWSGSVTGTAVMRVEARNKSTGVMAASSIAPLSATANTRIGNALNGDTYDYAVFGLARTTSAASTAAVTSMMAQLHPNTITPSLVGEHVSGQGQTGCKISGDLIEEYIHADDQGNRRLKSLSFGLLEVGAWL